MNIQTFDFLLRDCFFEVFHILYSIFISKDIFWNLTLKRAEKDHFEREQNLIIWALYFSNWKANLRFTQYDFVPFYNQTISVLKENHTSGAQFEPEKIIVWGTISITLRNFFWKFQSHMWKSQNYKAVPAMRFGLLNS